MLRALVGFATVVSSTATVLAQPPLYELELFGPIAPYEFTTPFGMNEAGAVVGYTAFDAFDPSATGVIIHPQTGISALSLIDPNYNFPYALNSAGMVVGQSGFRAFHWDGAVADPLRVPEGFFSGTAHDISDTGVIVGSYGDNDFLGPRHCYWPSASQEAILLPPLSPGNHDGSAWAINESGQIAGVSGVEGIFYAVLWDSVESPPIQIGPLPGAFNSEALGMNERGDVVGRSSFEDFSIEAMFWNSDGGGFLTGLGHLPGGFPYSEAFDVNDARQVVGVASAPEFTTHAFLWEGGVMYDLNDYLAPGGPPIQYLARAGSINNAGVIAVEVVLGANGFPRAIGILKPIFIGDANCDGVVNIDDADALALALVDRDAHAAAYPGCGLMRADVNEDLSLDGADVQAFVSMLLEN